MDDPFQPLPEDLAILCQHRRAFGPGPGSSPALGVESGRAVLGPVPEPWKGLVAAIGAVAVEPSGLKGMVYLL